MKTEIAHYYEEQQKSGEDDMKKVKGTNNLSNLNLGFTKACLREQSNASEVTQGGRECEKTGVIQGTTHL